MKLIQKILLVAVLMTGSLPVLRAQVTIAPSFTGTLIITLPDGDVTLLENGDPIPEIPQGATLEVFNGSIKVQTGSGDNVQMGCFGSGQSVGGGSSATLSCGETSGLLTIDGKEYPISGAPAAAAEPTADADPTGVPSDQDPDPDSRSIQASTIS